MKAKPLFAVEELLETARTLDPLQRQLLINLYDRGAGLLLELAMRVFKFPDEISQPVGDLRQRGLVTTADYAGGQLGSELLSLSDEGRELALLLKEPAVQKELQQGASRELAPQATALPPDPQQQELELVQKLAALAEQQGKYDEASQWYREALTITRKLSGNP